MQVYVLCKSKLFVRHIEVSTQNMLKKTFFSQKKNKKNLICILKFFIFLVRLTSKIFKFKNIKFTIIFISFLYQ